MNYAEHVAAAAAGIPPLTPGQLRTIATNLKHSGPGATPAKKHTQAAHRVNRYSIND